MSELDEYVEEIGLFFANAGLPRMPGRILGWLLVCEPAHQSADELAAALRVSSGSISMAVRMLVQAGAVERYALTGSRRTFYRLRPGFWLREAEEKAKLAADWRKLADRGLAMLSDNSGDAPSEGQAARSLRLEEMRDMYAFLETEYTQIEARWRQREKKQDKGKRSSSKESGA
ncbi:GbsR/MarR family transcriptional regulator [Tenggerimyces flavus]|uniref:GbsR/MarR family transcriptional regulator n=1 Tax=Tenggerimyces flavus TaxID=1708749 RepID=A0ABV7YF67_9ACTN|nr:MarR family transcriptional regulator [Tenggerimyces flavus]MBM7789154.1 DNA-binding transcriptional regulator GbsR (MarR family) [Tenggerimyces flavus]